MRVALAAAALRWPVAALAAAALRRMVATTPAAFRRMIAATPAAFRRMIAATASCGGGRYPPFQPPGGGWAVASAIPASIAADVSAADDHGSRLIDRRNIGRIGRRIGIAWGAGRNSNSRREKPTVPPATARRTSRPTISIIRSAFRSRGRSARVQQKPHPQLGLFRAIAEMFPRHLDQAPGNAGVTLRRARELQQGQTVSASNRSYDCPEGGETRTRNFSSKAMILMGPRLNWSLLPTVVATVALATGNLVVSPPAGAQTPPPPAPSDGGAQRRHDRRSAGPGRLALPTLSGSVSFHSASQDQWVTATQNYPRRDR